MRRASPKAAAAQEIKKLEEKLAAAKAKAEKNGCTLGADYVLVKGGQPVRAVRKMTAEEIDLIVRRVSPHRQNRHVHGSLPRRSFPAASSSASRSPARSRRNPTVLFMDEPLSNLDAKLRLEMRYELQRLHVADRLDVRLRHARPDGGHDAGNPDLPDGTTACSSSTTSR